MDINKFEREQLPRDNSNQYLSLLMMTAASWPCVSLGVGTSGMLVTFLFF